MRPMAAAGRKWRRRRAPCTSTMKIFAGSVVAMPNLPPLTNFDAFPVWRRANARRVAVARDIALRHGLGSAAPHIFATGTNLVVALDSRLILKIFPPMLRSQFVSERGALMQLHGLFSLPISGI